MAEAAYDAIVIGAGVIGCSVAYSLARGGRRVCVVDRASTVAGGSTSASSAIIRFNYSTWAGVASAWESKHVWEDWRDHLGGDDEAGLARYIKTGGLTLDSPQQDRHRVCALFEQAGVPFEVWDSAAIRQRLPLLDPGRHFPPKAITDEAFWAEPTGELGGCWTPDSGFVDDPQLAAHNLMQAATRHGAHLRLRSTVTEIKRTSDHVSGLGFADGSQLAAPIVVNVAGPHSGAINALADLGDDFAIGTRPLRQEVHDVRAPSGYNLDGAGPLIADMDLGSYFRGTPGDGLLVGGIEPACDPLEWLDDPDDFETNPTKSVHDAQVYRVARRIPTLGVPDAPRGVAGVYDVSDDWIPIYDKTALGGYYVAIGTSGNQFKNAPVVGEYIAAIIDACESGHDHDEEPVRVELARTGHEIDLAHYSRRRATNEGSSFTVMG
jgi:sarcosine oxidase subunit beta